MKARIDRKKLEQPKSYNSKTSDKKINDNYQKGVFNLLYSLIDQMDSDDKLKGTVAKRLLVNSLSDNFFAFSSADEFVNKYYDYNEFKTKQYEAIEGLENKDAYKRFFSEHADDISVPKLVSAMILEIKELEALNPVSVVNYKVILNQLVHSPKINLFTQNYTSSKLKTREGIRTELLEKDPILFWKYDSQISHLPSHIKTFLSNDSVFRVQHIQDFTEYINGDDIKFKTMSLQFIFSGLGYDQDIGDENGWIDTEAYKTDGYKITQSVVNHIHENAQYFDIDKMMLVIGYRALESLEGCDNRVPITDLLGMIDFTEQNIKDHTVKLSDPTYDFASFKKRILKNPAVMAYKRENGTVHMDFVSPDYFQNVIDFDDVNQSVTAEDLQNEFTPEMIVKAYNVAKKHECKREVFNRFMKMYRDIVLKSQRDNGTVDEERLEKLKELLQANGGNQDVVDFYKMGIFNISDLVRFKDSTIIFETFLSGAMSKSDIGVLHDLGLVDRSKLRKKLSSTETVKQGDFIKENLNIRSSNLKRKLIYALDEDATSTNIGNNFEVFFLRDKAVLIDSMSKKENTNMPVSVMDATRFEEVYGLNGFWLYQLEDPQKRVNLNKDVSRFMKTEGGTIIPQSKKMPIEITRCIISDEEREEEFDGEDIGSQNKIMKDISDEFEK